MKDSEKKEEVCRVEAIPRELSKSGPEEDQAWTLEDLQGLSQLVDEARLRPDKNAGDLLAELEKRVNYYERLRKCVSYYLAREDKYHLSISTFLRPFLAVLAKSMGDAALAGMGEPAQEKSDDQKT